MEESGKIATDRGQFSAATQRHVNWRLPLTNRGPPMRSFRLEVIYFGGKTGPPSLRFACRWEFGCVTRKHDRQLVGNAGGIAVERALRGDFHLLPERRHNMSKNKIRPSFSVVDLINSKREKEDRRTARMSAFAVAKVTEISHLDHRGVCS